MAIHFHCEHCGKKIEAPTESGGKRGKCPVCKNRVYIPLDTDTEHQEELKLAPLDDNDETLQKNLFAETFQLAQDILKEKAVPEPETTNDVPAAGSEIFIPPVQYDNKELRTYIVKYLRLVADGELDRANDIIEILAEQAEQTMSIIDEIALSGIPDPELAKIPRQILPALIRNLRNQISQ